jgi:hypothetical protein
MTVSISLLQRIFTPPKLCVNCIKVEILKLELGKQCLKLTTAVVKIMRSPSRIRAHLTAFERSKKALCKPYIHDLARLSNALNGELFLQA